MIDYEKELNPEQLEAVTTINGPVCINAGAGSGKTRVLTYRTMYMIEHGIQPENILLLTFTNKAANEMKERICKLVPVGERVMACTFHSFCVEVLRSYGEMIGIKDFTILASGDDAEIISMIRAADKNYKYTAKFPKSPIVASILSNSVNTQRTVEKVIEEDYSKYDEYTFKIQDLIKRFDTYRKENNTLNYDDLLTCTLTLFEKVPDVVRILADKYKYIMVDEYQDSNTLQEKILFSFSKYHKNIAIVGDAVQSLYGFRGADIKNIIDFPERFENCKQIYLKRNYRSNQSIIEFSNAVTENATETKPHHLEAVNKTRNKPKVVQVLNNSDEADWILEKIQNLLECGMPPKEICVLFRSSYTAAFLEGALNNNQIPYVKYGGRKYFDLEYVKDVLSYMRIFVNPHDEIAWFRCVQQVGLIGDANARRIASICKSEGVEGMLNSTLSGRVFYDDLCELHDFIEKMMDTLTTKNINDLIDFYCTFKVKKIQKAKFEKEENRQDALDSIETQKENLQALNGLVSKCPSIKDFLDSTIDNPVMIEDTDKSIVLSTIHSAKGLEFDTVFVMDCVDGIFPTTTAARSGSHKDNEELRCFYVAVTRCANDLYLLWPKNVMKFGHRVKSELSHFIPDDCMYDMEQEIPDVNYYSDIPYL